ncbi:MAG: RNA 2',3'-cyclic phosphodiesterase [Desulfuromonadales bacterium]|nr:RNA 2',3'-cyclic phosphodiesterase [Desulfuromonadales bacterium]
MSSVRAFLAIPLPQQLKDAVKTLQRNLQAQIPDARWVRPENLHLTLHFFGDVEQETLEKIKVSVLSVKGCKRPLTVEVKGLGAFPNWHRPRILWLDLEPKDQLRQLYESCREQLQHVGLVTDSRPYSPHLTIGRLRQRKSCLTDLNALNASIGGKLVGRFSVDRLILFESRLHADGAEHIPLLTVNLDESNHL